MHRVLNIERANFSSRFHLCVQRLVDSIGMNCKTILFAKIFSREFVIFIFDLGQINVKEFNRFSLIPVWLACVNDTDLYHAGMGEGRGGEEGIVLILTEINIK